MNLRRLKLRSVLRKGLDHRGRMLSPAIMSAAIEDALSPYGVQITSLPISAEQIVEWVAAGKQGG